jgi:hypothetical protein
MTPFRPSKNTSDFLFGPCGLGRDVTGGDVDYYDNDGEEDQKCFKGRAVSNIMTKTVNI